MLKRLAKKLNKFYFFGNPFVLNMLFLGILANAGVFYFVKSKLDKIDFNDSVVSGMGYEIIASFDKNQYQIPFILLGFLILNLILARIVYKYDIFASYILISSAFALNVFYLVGIFIFLN